MARWFFLISFFGFFFWPVSLVFANGVVIEPAFQFVTIQGDQDQSSATIKLTNQSDSAQIYHLTTIDIRQLDETGRVGLVDKPTTDAQYSLAEYLQLPEQQIELEPGQSREVTVNVKNSLELSPGGHYGAVLAEVISQGNDGETSRRADSHRRQGHASEKQTGQRSQQETSCVCRT